MSYALHPRIANRVVHIGEEPGLFHPLPHSQYLVDRRVVGDGLDDMPDQDRINAKADRVLALCGRSRARRKAQALAFALHMDLSYRFVRLNDKAVEALAAALLLPSPVHGAGPAWLVRGDADGVDGNALKLIADVRAMNGVDLHSRRAMLAYIDWHRRERLVVPVVGINALAFVTGFLRPDGELEPNQVRSVIGHILKWTLTAATVDAKSRLGNGRKASPREYLKVLNRNNTSEVEETRRILNRLRESEGYQQVEAAVTRELTAESRAAEKLELDRAKLTESSAWSIFNRSKSLNARATGESS